MHVNRLSWICLAILSLCLRFTLAVWDDEAFVVDWHIPQLGAVDDVVIHVEEDATCADSVSLITKSNILAAVSGGAIRWRLQLDGPSALVSLGKDTIATVTNLNGRATLNSWNATNGFLKAQLASFEQQVADIESSYDHSHVIVVLADGSVLTVDTKTFEKSSKGAIETFGEVKANALENGNFVILYQLKDTQNARFAFFDGAALNSHALTFAYDTIVEFFGAKVVAYTTKYYAISIDKNTGIASAPHPLVTADKHIPINTDSLVAFEINRNLEVYTLTGQKQFTVPNVYKYYFQYVNGVFVMYTEYHANILDAEDGTELVSYFLGDEKLPFDEIKRFLPTTNGIDIISSTIVYKNETYTLLHNNDVLFTRDFSLTNVVAHTVVDLDDGSAVVEEEIRHEEELLLWEAYLSRCARHLSELKSVYDSFSGVIPHLLRGEWPFDKSRNDEYFGFVKYLVLAAKNGQVVAMNTLNGERVWRFDTQQSDIISIETVGNEIYVFTASGPRFIIDSKTGAEIEKQLLQPANKVITLDKDEGSFLMEAQTGVDLILSKEAHDAYFVRHDDKTISGFKAQDRKTHKTWTYDTSNDEIIAGYAARLQDEKTASIGVVLGDRSVLYKYLYPNIAAFGVLNSKTNVLYTHIIDTLTGQFLFSDFHANVTDASSYKVIVGEHWVVYTYYSHHPGSDQKVVVVDLFESLVPNTRFSTSSSISSFNSSQVPVASTKSFISPHKIKSLGLTATRFGVTTKTVLFAFENNQIAYLPKPFLNSRRVAGRELTSDEKAEFLMMPYDPILKFDDSLVLSHIRTVMGSDNIVSLPTNLESTSIVCTYGLDVFCTRVAPSSQFDKLTSSFDKVKLMLSLILLVGTVAVLSPMKSAKELKNLWVISPSR